MRRTIRLVHLMVISAILMTSPGLSYGRGAGGGGHGAGGGRGGGTRGMAGGTGIRGYGTGNRGYGPVYAGRVAGYRGYGGYGGGGWGYPRYYGWGFPYYGYGLGLGFGLGYGLSSGYGYGGYAYPAYVYGYPASSYGDVTYVGANNVATTNSVPSSVLTASATTSADPEKVARSKKFIDQGIAAFRAADYATAVSSWRHAVVEDPENPHLALQLALALFATGKYEEAAGATQAAMLRLPKEEWGAAVIRFHEFYGKTQDYTDQLRALEKAVNRKPGDPALRFLAGYHYGYLGFHKHSIDQLEKGIQLEPRDELAKQLRDEMRSKAIKRNLPPPPAPIPAASETWTNSQ